jgi:hypothetical protein
VQSRRGRHRALILLTLVLFAVLALVARGAEWL